MDAEKQETLKELTLLRFEYEQQLSSSADEQQRYRRVRMIQELSACIERPQQELNKA